MPLRLKLYIVVGPWAEIEDEIPAELDLEDDTHMIPIYPLYCGSMLDSSV